MGRIGIPVHRHIGGHIQPCCPETQTSPLDFTRTVHLVDVAFIPAARNQGYGTALLRAIQQAAASIKAPVTLTVMSANLPAKRLYTKMGFQLDEPGPMYDRMIWYPDAQAMRGG